MYLDSPLTILATHRSFLRAAAHFPFFLTIFNHFNVFLIGSQGYGYRFYIYNTYMVEIYINVTQDPDNGEH